MAWFQSTADDIRTYAQVHEGVGPIQVSRLFRDTLNLPIHVQIWELEPGVSEGDHTHPTDDPTDSYEELYLVLSGSGTITIDGDRRAIGPDDAVLVPTGVHHGVYADRGETLRFLLILGKPPAG
jgi:quercetin dioxygenase-like cupin family protein